MSAKGHDILGRGTDGEDSVDYPDHAHAVATDVEEGKASLGILICGSANGVAMTANKHAGVRAAIAWTSEIAALGRQHNNANVLCIPARFVSEETALSMVDVFFESSFEGGRHERRVGKIACAMLAALLGISSVVAQVSLTPEMEEVKLDAEQMRMHLDIFGSDGFEGRETGEAGQKGGSYLEAYYSSLGFQPCNDGSFFQMVPVLNVQISGGTISISQETLTLAEDFLLYPGLDVTTLTNEALTFVSHGIDDKAWNDYKKFKGEGVVMFLDGEPTRDGASLLTKDGSASLGQIVERQGNRPSQRSKGGDCGDGRFGF